MSSRLGIHADARGEVKCACIVFGIEKFENDFYGNVFDNLNVYDVGSFLRMDVSRLYKLQAISEHCGRVTIGDGINQVQENLGPFS